MRTLLALDGGNSKTDIVLVSEDGTVLARTRSGPFIPHLAGADRAVDLLADDIERALASAPGGRVDLIAGYLANADLPVEEERIAAAITSHAWSDRVIVENDTLAMLRTGTDSGHGVAVVCGAGINCVGVGENGERVRFPALGRITGDWGGGLGIAKEVLWHTSRAHDGRGPATTLSQAVAAHFGLASAAAVAEAMHLRTFDYDRMHEIVPLLFREANAGDEIARTIVQRQAQEVALLVTNALERLRLTDGTPDVVLGGGMLTSGEPLLLGVVVDTILAAAPGARITIAADKPVLGSALLGLDALLGPDAGSAEREARLRETLDLAGALQP
ncbi:MAG: N-acetylglucosamine kinase [Demequina sp.]|nr:N-acetylglucosamine kinase [Demequina sp.]